MALARYKLFDVLPTNRVYMVYNDCVSSPPADSDSNIRMQASLSDLHYNTTYNCRMANEIAGNLLLKFSGTYMAKAACEELHRLEACSFPNNAPHRGQAFASKSSSQVVQG